VIRRIVVFALCASFLLAPLGTSARASAGDSSPESRIGVLLMATCGFALKASLIAPVPWAGIAALSCTFGLLDAAMSEDPPAGSPHHP
jgi:hypothetical protein